MNVFKRIFVLVTIFATLFALPCSDTIPKKFFSENISFTKRAIENIKVTPINEDNVISEECRQSFLRFINIEDGRASIEDALFFACDEENSTLTKAQVDFVCENIEVANRFVDDGYGYLDKNGEFHLTVQNEDFLQQESLISNFFFSIWSGWSFHMCPMISGIVGIIGILSNMASIFCGIQSIIDFSGTMSTPYYQLTKGLPTYSAKGVEEVLTPYVGAKLAGSLAGFISTFFSNLNLSWEDIFDTLIPAIVNAISLITVICTKTPGIGWIVSLIATVIACYTPNVFAGLQMICGWCNDTGADGNIGLWWSSYKLCYGC